MRSVVPIAAFIACACASLTSACGDDPSVADTAPADTAGDSGDSSDGDGGGGGGPLLRCASQNPLKTAFFGDLHVHTGLSLDANVKGTRARPADAYRFARGESIGLPPFDDAGAPLRTLQIDRPLDFAAVTDHAEFLGTVHACLTPEAPAYEHEECVRYREQPGSAFITLNAYVAAQQDSAAYPKLCGDSGGEDCVAGAKILWQETIDAAEAANDTTDACAFTAFIGYEWSGAPGTRNMHRNVIFRNAAVPGWATNYFDGGYPADLWRALRRDCLDHRDDDIPDDGGSEIAGCDVLAIPHNTNISGGYMFGGERDDRRPMDEAIAREMAELEPVLEIMQHKGQSECQQDALGDDECAFEWLPYNSLAGAALDFSALPETRDFTRWALSRGLQLADSWGVNPYGFGFIGSTDTHMATPGAVREDDFRGHGGAGKGNADGPQPGLPDTIQNNPGGLAVIWAEENSREALFAGLRAKEVYATSGPRIILRFFGGQGYKADLCEDADWLATAYAGGVPMGGSLTLAADAPQAPTFVVSAMADLTAAAGGPLQKIEIIKGWYEGEAFKTKVFLAAGDAQTDASVDATCARTDDGHASLCGTWTDPEFNPAQRAWYYARVIETPSCRWSTLQCVAAGVDCDTPETITEGFEGCCDTRWQRVIKERAWSSPIWVQPAP